MALAGVYIECRSKVGVQSGVAVPIFGPVIFSENLSTQNSNSANVVPDVSGLLYLAVTAMQDCLVAIGPSPSTSIKPFFLRTGCTRYILANPGDYVQYSNSPSSAGNVVLSEDTSQSGAVTGTITANAQTVELPLKGFNGATFAWWGTFAGITLNWEVCYDNIPTTWVAITGLSVAGGNAVAAVGPLATNGAYEIYAPGATHLRVRVSAYTSGTMNVRAIPAVFAADISPSIGNSSVPVILSAGANAAADVGVQYRANATGAASIAPIQSPATPAIGTIKASAGRIVGLVLSNSAAALRSVKIFNATAPTLGTTAAVFEIDIPAGGSVVLAPAGGIGFATGITWSVTSAKGLTDNTSTGLAANDVSGAVFYA